MEAAIQTALGIIGSITGRVHFGFARIVDAMSADQQSLNTLPQEDKETRDGYDVENTRCGFGPREPRLR